MGEPRPGGVSEVGTPWGAVGAEWRAPWAEGGGWEELGTREGGQDIVQVGAENPGQNDLNAALSTPNELSFGYLRSNSSGDVT